MKKLTVTEIKANEVDYAAALRSILESDNFILSIPLYNAKKNDYKNKIVNCKLDGITDIKTFKKTLLKAVMTYQGYTLKAEKKKLEDRRTKKNGLDKADEEILQNIENFLQDFEKTCKAYILQSDELNKLDNLTTSIACFLAGSALPEFWHKSEEIAKVIADLSKSFTAETETARNIEKKAAKKELSYFIYKYFNVGMETAESPLFTRLKSNAGLLNNIMSRYYSGRKLNKNGSIEQTFSDKAAKNEILLAILDYKQQLANAATIQSEEVTKETKTA